MKIVTRLKLGFGLVLALLLLIAVIGTNQLSEVQDNFDIAIKENAVRISLSNKMINQVNIIARSVRSMALAEEDSDRQLESEIIAAARKEYNALRDKLSSMALDDAGKKIMDDIENDQAVVKPFIDKAMKLAMSGFGAEGGMLLMRDAKEPQTKWLADLNAMITLQEKLNDDLIKHANQEYQSGFNLVLALTITAIVSGIGIAVWITRSITRPVNKAVGIAEKIAVGDFSARIDTSGTDEIGMILRALSNAITSVKSMSDEVGFLTQAAVEGRLSTRADASKHEGDFRKIVLGVNDTLDAVIGPLNVAADYVANISRGNIPAKITDTYNGDFNTIKNNLNTCIDAVNLLVADAAVLSKAAVEGKLATRADASRHQGDFRKVVSGVNDTLDAVIGPLNVAANYVENISRGNIPAKITDTYNGDFNTIKNNLNTCIDAVNLLVADAGVLSRAAVEGKLATRADASRHQGDFQKIVVGVNDTLDAVIGPLNVAADYVANIAKGTVPPRITDTYNGDFNTIKNNLNACIDATRQQAEAAQAIALGDLSAKITVRSEQDVLAKSLIEVIKAVNALVSDANMLSDATVNGKLDTRIDTSKHQGDFRKVVEGLNAVMLAMNAPVQELRNVLGTIESGDLTLPMKQNYNGTWDELKSAVNNMLHKLSQVVADVNNGAQALASASEEVSATTQALSQAASQQAASVEETSASIEQITSSISQNTENAKITEGMASKAAANAVESGESVNATVSAMKQIAQKISIIDDIAAQTNLLALNAAIEAARAGEHGKGFAVVAAEVRKLAERSQVAAQEIGEVASSSVELAEKAGKLLEQMVPAIRKTSDLVQEISVASTEQASGVSQINSSMGQLNQTTQQNASSSEELAATSEEMSSQAEQLQQIMSFFKLKDADHATVRTLGREKTTKGLNSSRKPTRNPVATTAFDMDRSQFSRF
ncbi:MAG: HAMP domain-containing protein [Rhodoferax sp.]|nr:HAMP domain-containing protein [Rhodoferax sp.]